MQRYIFASLNRTMIKPFFLFSACALFVACGNEPDSNGQQSPDSTAAAANPAIHYYGDSITADGAMPIAEFVSATANTDSLDAKVTCEIITSCQKKGCWMDVKLKDGSAMKVRFTDYAYFVPTAGLEGKTAIIEGTASREVISEAMRRHYAEDAGKSKEECEAIKGDETKLSFLADGVLIKM